jgi:uncharacterized protein (DUF934 family)
MLLLDREGAKADVWTRVETLDLTADNVIVALAQLRDALAARRPGQHIGAAIDNTERAAALEPFFRELALIVIAFPTGYNGRGLSIARQLRERGFVGALRASGPLVSDQFPHALACGFDEIELPDDSAKRQPVEQWLDAAQRISVNYQRGYSYGAVTNILEQRRAARLAGVGNNV